MRGNRRYVFVNNITAIVCAALLLIVGLVTPGTMKDIVAEKDGEIGMEGLENLLKHRNGCWCMDYGHFGRFYAILAKIHR